MKQVLIAVDQLLNTIISLFIGGGWADETLSSRAHREWPTVASAIDKILFFDPDHCRMSYESERLRLHLPPEFRQ